MMSSFFDRNILDTPFKNYPSIHILLVEDNEMIQMCSKMFLKKNGCQVTVAISGEEALEKFGIHIDGILMDIGLPGIDGCETTEQIRKQYPDNPICIYAHSAFDRDMETKCREFGMDGFIQKPCRQEDLEAFLLSVTNKLERAKNSFFIE